MDGTDKVFFGPGVLERLHATPFWKLVIPFVFGKKMVIKNEEAVVVGYLWRGRFYIKSFKVENDGRDG